MAGSMTGYHITFGLNNFDHDPLFRYDKTSGEWDGFLIDLIDMLSRYMGFTYAFAGGTGPGARPRTGPGGRAWTHMTRGALPRPPSACSAARDAAPSAELWFGVMAPEGMKSPPGVDDGRGDPVHGGTIDAMMMSSLWLSKKSYANVTCGADYHVDCLYDYSYDNWLPRVNQTYGGLFASWPHAPQDWPHLEQTAPYYSSSMGALVKVAAPERDMWRIFAPFSATMWFAACLTFVIIALLFNLVLTIDAIRPPPRTQRGGEHAGDEPQTSSSSVSLVTRTPQWPGAPRRSPTKDEATDAVRTAFGGIATSLYHTTAVCLGGEESEWAYSARWPVRLLRIALLLCVLVLVATYTANLAAFFTADTSKVYGPKSFAELNAATGCYNGVYWPGKIYLKDVTPPVYPSYIIDHEHPEVGIIAWDNTATEAGRQYCLDAV